MFASRGSEVGEDPLSRSVLFVGREVHLSQRPREVFAEQVEHRAEGVPQRAVLDGVGAVGAAGAIYVARERVDGDRRAASGGPGIGSGGAAWAGGSRARAGAVVAADTSDGLNL